MKKLVLVSLFISVFGSSLAMAGTRAGLQVGLNLASASVSSNNVSVDTSTRTGFMVGGHAEFELSDIFFLQPELMYAQKGASISGITFKLDYLEIPLLLKAKAGSDALKPFLFAGPNLGFKLSSSATNGTTSIDVTAVESTDIAMDMGGGLEYAIDSNVGAFLSVRYSLGLNDIDKTTAEWKSRGIQFLTGVSFAL